MKTRKRRHATTMIEVRRRRLECAKNAIRGMEAQIVVDNTAGPPLTTARTREVMEGGKR